MIVGIPNALLYPKYHTFMETFFKELGADVLTSPNTNRHILDEGVKYCVDEACLPVKVFHGHVAWLKDKCDAILIPRIMQVRGKEYICPKFCGLTEMVSNSIPDLPILLGDPIYLNNSEKFVKWAIKTGSVVNKNMNVISDAFTTALNAQMNSTCGLNDNSHNLKVALLGHPYCIYDEFINMSIVKKLSKLDIGVITGENVSQKNIQEEVNTLYKRPFWNFAKNIYGSSLHLYKNKKIDGIIYISSFACGIDSVLIEMLQIDMPDIPFLVLKIDEQTGEAGFDTRIEAFSDMLQRRNKLGDNISTYGQRLSCIKSSI